MTKHPALCGSRLAEDLIKGKVVDELRARLDLLCDCDYIARARTWTYADVLSFTTDMVISSQHLSFVIAGDLPLATP